MYRIAKQFRFSASHRLAGLPEEHPCSRLHGHNYLVEVELQSQSLDAVGFVVDYGELKALKQYLDAELDHRHLNDVLACNPTAEKIAEHLFDWCFARWPQTRAVRVSETPSTWAEYRAYNVRS